MASQPNQPSQEQLQEIARQQAQFLAKVWSDPQLKQRLMQDPKSVLREHGMPVPEGIELRVVENTDQVMYLIVPPPPSDTISDEQLDAVAGGAGGPALSTFLLDICILSTFANAPRPY